MGTEEYSSLSDEVRASPPARPECSPTTHLLSDFGSEDDEDVVIDVRNNAFAPPNRRRYIRAVKVLVGMVAGAIMAAGVTFAVLSARPEVSASSDPFAFPCDAVPEMSQVGEIDSAGVTAWCSKTKACVKSHYGAIVTESLSRQSTVMHYNKLQTLMSNIFGTLAVLENASPEAEIVAVAITCSSDISAYVCAICFQIAALMPAGASLGLDVALFTALDKASNMPPTDTLEDLYLDDVLRGFRRGGVQLDALDRDRLQELAESLERLSTEFSQNILKAQGVVEVNISDINMLGGLDDAFIASHTSEDGTKVLITTDYPDYFPIMRTATSSSLRKQLYELFQNRAYPENEGTLLSIIKARSEMAKILGFPTFADFATAALMTKNSSTVEKFLSEIAEIVDSTADAELATLQAFRDETESHYVIDDEGQRMAVSDPIMPYDFGFYKNQFIKATYGVDSSEVKKFFRISTAMQGLFQTVRKVFGVVVEPDFGRLTWHPDVLPYTLHQDDDAHTLLGRFFLDLHPRENKFKHAAMFPIRKGVAGVQLPEAALICNFARDSENLEYGEVITLFHEFGHLLHHIIGGQHQRYIGLSGIATEWDFVEAPSQLFEHWPRSYETLKIFATDRNTNETLSQNLFDKMSASSAFGRAMSTKQQLYYSQLSLALHTVDADELDIEYMAIEVETKYGLFSPIEGTHFYASFGHLNGYSSNYYTYQWSLAIAQDLFYSRFKQNIYNQTVAAEYIRDVISPGGTKHASDLVSEFLGREWNSDNFKHYLVSGTETRVRHAFTSRS